MTLERHDITIDRFVKGKCQVPGHYNSRADCSCGWSHTISHGGDHASAIVGHRLQTIERKLNLRVTVRALN